ncbi:MAG: hypothetical protein COV60_01010 [Candidatus Magasanikbacteria bacterium CG11_big_fil_rev_8_21_14_0_20_43_7]|uniref:NadR/Ttd14 AAA domain-containing protein n=1 Tax=Candidatus Magasanikbacteria bacterium CG11_big_fil_rev_8_21_14_0_20_43_7 TaxID=1974654 RepID=A0A2H0N352_9BACT|nr:MAG: hypothetical protein COV60_01010 [Candidatus Magasanikbacteria bacterium CG11_big_fil_rev_8_21_14_0_20_43_7]
MNIAIVGTHSTGKTTLVHALTSMLAYKRYSPILLREYARECPYPINERTSLQAQQWIQDEQEKNEQHYITRESWVVSDRCMLDNLAYMQCVAGGRDITHAITKAVEGVMRYDLVFKTQMLDLPATDDRVRSVDSAFRKKIDEYITALFINNRIPFLLLPPTTNYDTHVGFICSHIERVERYR